MRRRSKMKALKIPQIFVQGQSVVYWVLTLLTHILCEPGMRRRSKMKALKIPQIFVQGQSVVYWVLTLLTHILCEPGYLDFDNLPETNFTCAGKVIGGYYADLETSCQMFHVCTIGQLDEPMDIKFLCLNGTVFDQETRVCERVDEVDCTKSEKFYYLNLELYGNTMLPMPEEESCADAPNVRAQKTSNTATTISSISPILSSPETMSNLPSNERDIHKQHTKLSTYSSDNANPVNDDQQIMPIIFNSTTTKEPEFEPEELEPDYEYEEDYYSTVGKEYQSNKNQNQNRVTQNNSSAPIILTTTARTMTNIMSPHEQRNYSPSTFTAQQFILSQHKAKQSLISLEPISFQQQNFQNGGSLSLTSSHIKPNSHHTTNTKTLLTPENDEDISKDPKDLSYLQSFRVQGQGFRLPSNNSSSPYGHEQHVLKQQQHDLLQKHLSSAHPFAGYQKQQKPQISLRLPIEKKAQPSLDSIVGIFGSADEHKDILQSSEHSQSRRTTSASANSKEYKHSNDKYRLTNANNEERILLTPQEHFRPTLPKVIITASASVSDANGKKLNYSVGKNIQLPPNLDDYREDDISLHPLFLDVLKISPSRS